MAKRYLRLQPREAWRQVGQRRGPQSGTANRNTNDPTNRTTNNGFRLASTLAQ